MHHYRVRRKNFLIDLEKNDLLHCLKSLAGWTFAFKDYYDSNITRYLNNFYLQKLATIVDPYCKSFFL